MGRVILAEAHRRHQHAVAAYLACAATLPESDWQTARNHGKWSPAEITAHLTLGFHALQQDVLGGPPMQRRIIGWKLLIARWKYMRRILADGEFPAGARAPRETRPAGAMAAQAHALENFRHAAAAWEQHALTAHATRPWTRLTHPYFGRVSLAQALFISAKHIEHHSKQLTDRLPGDLSTAAAVTIQPEE